MVILIFEGFVSKLIYHLLLYVLIDIIIQQFLMIILLWYMLKKLWLKKNA